MNTVYGAYFEKYFQKIVDQLQKDKDNQDFVVIKSWNEWAEGNYMEPDLQYGHGYINALAEAIKES